MRLMDVQVSLQSVPEQARVHGMEIAATSYKQIQALGQSLKESQTRPEQVIQAQPDTTGAFTLIDSRVDPRRKSDRQHVTHNTFEEPKLYSARGTKQLPVQPAGQKLDLFI
ncbi:MAG: hypothetical protein JNM27_13290 [Leptospirales bacterium]|nr:hypothetical protein [Leptospirales bacterium]